MKADLSDLQARAVQETEAEAQAEVEVQTDTVCDFSVSDIENEAFLAQRVRELVDNSTESGIVEFTVEGLLGILITLPYKGAQLCGMSQKKRARTVRRMCALVAYAAISEAEQRLFDLGTERSDKRLKALKKRRKAELKAVPRAKAWSMAIKRVAK